MKTMDRACPAVLARLQRGPATTIELQAEILTTHVAKPIFDLRQAGHKITTKRLPNGVALYTLLSEPPLGTWADDERQFAEDVATRALRERPQFGDVQLIREMRR